jgi:hypothetical protein
VRHTVGLAFEDAKRVLSFLAPRSPGAVINLEILKSLSEAVAERRSYLDPSYGNCHVSKLFSSELLEPNARVLERYATEEAWCQSDFFEDRTLVDVSDDSVIVDPLTRLAHSMQSDQEIFLLDVTQQGGSPHRN